MEYATADGVIVVADSADEAYSMLVHLRWEQTLKFIDSVVRQVTFRSVLT